MKRYTLTLALFCACCPLAYAGSEPLPSKEIAPAPPPPTSCFEGWYFGIHGGGILGKLDEETFAFEQTISPASGELPGVVDTVFDRSGKNDEWSWEAGFHGGYNWQRGNWVFGLEVDLSATNLERHDSADAFFVLPPGTPFIYDTAIDSKTELDWYSTGRLRAGYVFGDRFMIFGTGGGAVALAGVSESTLFRESTPFGGAVTELFRKDNNDIRGGWTVGGGFDICLSQHWMLNFTYLYMDLGDKSASTNVFVTSTRGRTFESHTSVDTELNFHIFRGGLTFHF